MKVTVVGFWGGYPHEDGATSTYLIEKDDFTLVIDFGSGALSKLQKYKNVTDIDAVILSHYHADHIADIGVLQHALIVHQFVQGDLKPIPIYGHGEAEIAFSTLTDDYTEGIVYEPDEVLKIGPFFIRFMRTKHSVPCFGMRITDGEHTVVYTADSAYKDEWIPFCIDADLLITDCNFYAGQDAAAAGHMTSEQGATIAKEANVKQLLLSHLPQFGNQEQLVEEAESVFSGNIVLAKEGLVWDGNFSE